MRGAIFAPELGAHMASQNALKNSFSAAVDIFLSAIFYSRLFAVFPHTHTLCAAGLSVPRSQTYLAQVTATRTATLHNAGA